MSKALVSLVSIGFILALLNCGSKKADQNQQDIVRPVKMMTLTSEIQTVQRAFPGNVRAAQRIDLSFQVAGTLSELNAEEGKSIRSGDLVARLDPRDFETSLRNSEGQLEKARATLQLARSEYERIRNIRNTDAGAVSQSMVEKRLEEMKAAEASLKSIQAAVDAAKDQLNDTRLLSPIDGIIAKRHVENYQAVQAKQPIVSIQDVSSIEVVVDIPEGVVARSSGRNEGVAFAEFAALPGELYPLTLKEFSPEADPGTQTYRVILSMPRPEGLSILPGMTVSVIGSGPQSGGTENGSVRIPAIAVFGDDAGQPHVWVVDPGTQSVQRRAIKTGSMSGSDSMVVEQGLQLGETIVIGGVSQIRDGMKVRPFDQEQE